MMLGKFFFILLEQDQRSIDAIAMVLQWLLNKIKNCQAPVQANSKCLQGQIKLNLLIFQDIFSQYANVWVLSKSRSTPNVC